MFSRRQLMDFCFTRRCGASVAGSRSVVLALELCLFLALAGSCSAALESDRTIAQFAHTAWGAKDGAPSPITALAQTSDGFLWVGSLDGLYQFDGLAFERYEPQSGGPLPVSGVNSLTALPNGDLWIGYSSGTLSLLRNGNVTDYTARDGLPNGGVWSLAQDREGTIWAATHAGLARLEGNRWRQVGKNWNFPAGLVRQVFLDRQGTLWVSMEDTLVFLPAGAMRFQPTGIRVGQVSQITQAPNGKLWMAETSRSVRPVPLVDHREPSDNTEVRVGSVGILFDKEGSLWITSLGDGLRRSQAPELLRGRIGEFSSAVESFTSKEGLSDDVIRAILQDHEGNIWVGTNNGLDRFRKTNLVPVTFPFRLGSQNVWAPGDDGDLWVEHVIPMIHIREGHVERSSSFPSSAIAAYRDPAGAIWWFCPFAIYRYDAGTYTSIALPPLFPKPYTESEIAITEDGSGTLWVAAVEGLFYRCKGEWHRLAAASEFAKSPPVTGFTDGMGRAWFGYEGGMIIVADHGTIQRVFPANDSPVGSVEWISGRGRHIWVGGVSGLAFFDGRSFRRVIPADAESFGSVGGVEETVDGSLWLAAKRGAIEIPATEIRRFLGDPSYRVKYRTFDSSDGLPGFYPKMIQTTDGKLWFSASNGLAWVDPARLFSNTLAPPVLIRSVKANGKQTASLTDLTLSPGTTNLQIRYAALSMSQPEKVRFLYRLEGVDKGWQDAGTRREAFYNGLGPGKYHFRVIACNDDGVWNDAGASLSFAIAPTWYQTIWFRGFYVLAVLTLLWAIYRMRVHQLQQQDKKFREAVETMPALAFAVDLKGNRTFMNRGWLEYTGLGPEDASASGLDKTLHPDDLERVSDRWRASVPSGQPLEYEARLRRGSDGIYRWFLIRAVPVRDKHGKILKWYGVATDIEDRKRAEQLQASLAHISRVNTMGELVASISHELAQPIMASTVNAKASLRWLQHTPPNLTKVQEGTEKIIEAGTFASQIIDRLRSLYKNSSPKRELFAMNDVIGEMILLLRYQASECGVSIRMDLAADLPKIAADRVQLQQVLMNLMLNGIEAMKGAGGVLTVKSQFREDGQIEISIHDTGPGLPADKLDQIFDAFFTTKPQGSGMGLAICRSIVESHGGRLWAASNDGQGAVFHFALPAVSAGTDPSSGAV